MVGLLWLSLGLAAILAGVGVLRQRRDGDRRAAAEAAFDGSPPTDAGTPATPPSPSHPDTVTGSAPTAR